jgi:hypothetical protein
MQALATIVLCRARGEPVCVVCPCSPRSRPPASPRGWREPRSKFDVPTHEALRAWQRLNGLPQTGYFGELSRKVPSLVAHRASQRAALSGREITTLRCAVDRHCHSNDG